VRPPVGTEHLAMGERRVLRLRRALYGLHQAPRPWNQCLEGKLRETGFKQIQADPSLWTLYDASGAILVMFYVDHGLVTARNAAKADG
jgi:hypothetical protein